jgi:hypothetical protein
LRTADLCRGGSGRSRRSISRSGRGSFVLSTTATAIAAAVAAAAVAAMMTTTVATIAAVAAIAVMTVAAIATMAAVATVATMMAVAAVAAVAIAAAAAIGAVEEQAGVRLAAHQGHADERYEKCDSKQNSAVHPGILQINLLVP